MRYHTPGHVISILCCVAMLAGCSSVAETEAKLDPKNIEQHSVEEIYNNASGELEKGNLPAAARLFDEVERQYPYSRWATQAQLMAAYAHYKDLKYDEAVLALDRFIQLHPGDENIAYAYYLKALCYYEQISDVRRDQKMTELALYNLSQVSQRFPDSKYARDANLKIDLTLDHLAGKEMEIGRYYLDRGHYQASINRFTKVVEEYQTTTHVPEALHRLVEAYTALGITPEAERAAAILGHNYPGSEWYEDSYSLITGKPKHTPGEESWYNRTIGRVF